MLFNSGRFLAFFGVVYLVYLPLPHRAQNVLLLAASYVFYASWDWRFCALLVFSTLLNYVAALGIERTRGQARTPRLIFWATVAANLGVLAFFKYHDFFAQPLAALLGSLGLGGSLPVLGVVLPVGLSFYTFQAMSYTIDVYRQRFPATRRLDDFALFVGFFPLLMAGPIERAGKLLRQIAMPRAVTVDLVLQGSWLVFWGLFKKVFIADNLAIHSRWSFVEGNLGTGPLVYLASLTFAVQMYCDFSGYCDMARGLAKVMGIDLSLNFRLPFSATNPTEFWARWHITLRDWFRDYVYGPLRNRLMDLGLPREPAIALTIVVTMALVGLWHGPNWTFVCWGAIWGLAMVAHRLLRPLLAAAAASPRLDRALRVLGTFATVNLFFVAMPFILAPSVRQAFGNWGLLAQGWTGANLVAAGPIALTLAYFTWPLVLVQALQYATRDLEPLGRLPFALRLPIYVALVFLLLVGGATRGEQFLYFLF
ncbi:MAG: MBOAT family protein [Deltaproteobacteria bacterium]|nr:MBOAT family protein [Deltaproteobacteria bacterium]